MLETASELTPYAYCIPASMHCKWPLNHLRRVLGGGMGETSTKALASQSQCEYGKLAKSKQLAIQGVLPSTPAALNAVLKLHSLMQRLKALCINRLHQLLNLID